ncbi:PTS glucose transporter subunit IIA [Virgibacillus sp. 179-BFC.A HS]|uniref:PTS glucose transporter subunit IIA n=1 Tax=Tigheibacillus jepli TaxID=3035914 RepID=A0ABU5CKJ0_9BACI|nr:PTS glucose transporter subunit IIA [Virgibacillus sp. 179-BFC.A HS]MDY0406830.1 PTS glucose transporter subunit IIA [Virgibacillus sp. 179-BFC.A HS]
MPLEEVPDPVFSEKMMGEGIAIIPSDGTIISPVDGEVVQVPATKHAVGLVGKDGTEILIHIGLETVELKGEGFTPKVQTGDKVSAGQPIMEVDLNYVREHAKDIVTPIVITNSGDSGKNYTLTSESEAKAGETVIITVSKNKLIGRRMWLGDESGKSAEQ